MKQLRMRTNLILVVPTLSLGVLSAVACSVNDAGYTYSGGGAGGGGAPPVAGTAGGGAPPEASAGAAGGEGPIDAGSGGGSSPEPMDACSPNPCLNQGECQPDGDSYQCTCRASFEGARCEDEVGDCAAGPCAHGICEDTPGGYSCSCDEGWAGLSCEENEDDCSAELCLNGGVCIDGVASHTCECAEGFAGTRCEREATDCSDVPCQHGARCTNTATSYECECSVGFSGRNCEIDVDDCAPNPCKNGGTCRDGVASHTCACPTGYFGLTCSAGFWALPFPSSTDNYAVASGVSANGLVVVGWAQGTNLSPRAFRWTSAGSKSLGVLADGTSSKAYGVSADGAVVVGEADANDTIVGFRWADNQMASLGLLEFGSVSRATAVSGDGNVIVGYGDNDTEPRALRWQMGAIGSISSVDSYEAYAVSSDGTVIAGHGGGAVRYAAGVATWLDSPAAITSVKVTGLSGNGRVIVGSGQRGAVQNALRWVDGVPENLGAAATDSTALATNRDGSVIVGTLRSEAMLWDAAGGMRPLSTLLTGLGVELSGFSALASATGVSANGKVVVGFGRRGARTEAWVLRLP